MWKWLFKNRCKHRYLEKDKEYVVFSEVPGGAFRTYLICEYCGKVKKVWSDEWEREQKIARWKEEVKEKKKKEHF
ncbi:hypothetical protein [Bacillus sp. AK128]